MPLMTRRVTFSNYDAQTQPGTSARREFQGEKMQSDWLTMHPLWFTDVWILSIGNIGYYGGLCEVQ